MAHEKARRVEHADSHRLPFRPRRQGPRAAPACGRALPPSGPPRGRSGRAGSAPLGQAPGGGNERRELPLPAAAGRAPAPRAPRRPASQRGPPGRDRGEPEPAAPLPDALGRRLRVAVGPPGAGPGLRRPPPPQHPRRPRSPRAPSPPRGPAPGLSAGPAPRSGETLAPPPSSSGPAPAPPPLRGAGGARGGRPGRGGRGKPAGAPRRGTGRGGEAGPAPGEGEEEERGGAGAEGGVSPGVLVYLGGSALGCR